MSLARNISILKIILSVCSSRRVTSRQLRKRGETPCQERERQFPFRQCVTTCLAVSDNVSEELSGRKLDKNKVVATPFLDENLKVDKYVTDGVLSSKAVRILMKVLYAARIGRWDLLRSVTYLSRRVTRWNPDCDRRLLRLTMYINCTVDDKAEAFAGEGMDSCQLAVCCDADLASDHEGSKSASGIWIAILGEFTYWPLVAISKRQGATSHSTSEAELIAIELAVRQEAIPLMMLWDQVSVLFRGGKPLPNMSNVLFSKTIMPRFE